MAKKFVITKRFSAVLMAGLIALNVTGYTQISAQPVAVTQSVKTQETLHNETQKNERYLEVYFNLNTIPDVISWDFMNGALAKVSEIEINHNQAGAVKFLEAVKTAVGAAQFEALALTYPESKVEATLKSNGITQTIEQAYRAYVACALDTQLIKADQVNKKDINRMITKDETINLLMAIANSNGKTRNFIGYTNDPDIYGKLIKAREAFVLFENEKLQKIGEEAVRNKVTTGYNLISEKYSANFIPELTLRYGHSTTTHATQLIGLLKSEGIVAKIQLEPKTSVFEYLPEWGDVPPATPDYKVQVVSKDLMLAHSLEYDLVLEFETEADKLKFDGVIESYAKKNDSNQGEGLLFASWWQPLYVSSVEMQDGYKQIYDNVITDGEYSLHPFCLPENKEAVIKGFKAIASDIEIKQVPIWCNDAFYRYLNGDYQ